MKQEINLQRIAQICEANDIVAFSEEILGVPLHPGQKYWLQQSWRTVNILKPANQWGKTTGEAIMHIFQAMTKPMFKKFHPSFETWWKFRYLSLNFGVDYETAKGVSEHIRDIVDGEYLLPDGTFNKSLLKGWAIRAVWDYPKLPKIIWFNNSETLIRSYNQLGKAFKRLRLAFVSGDECGDIPELKLFLSGTLMPRVAFFQGSIHLIGTSQPKGLEYEEIAEEAEAVFMADPDNPQYFIISFNSNPDMASLYRNDFMPTEAVYRIEDVADPELRKQIIYGQYVDYSDHLYTFDEVSNIFRRDIPYDPSSGFSEAPIKDEHYLMSVDLAAAKDETSISVVRYNVRLLLGDGSVRKFPNRLVFHKFWRGDTMPLSLQYALIKEYYRIFKKVSPVRTKFLYDAGSLGGKNAGQAFKDLGTIYPFPPKGRSYAEIKAEMFGKVKEVLGRDRRFIINERGERVDGNPMWGWIRASAALVELRRQFETASKDDGKLKNDQFTSLAMALHFIESRVPKMNVARAVDYNPMGGGLVLTK